MGALDYIGNEEDGMGFDDEGHPPREVRCRDCGSEDVYWALDRNDRWVLYNFNSRMHVCKSNVVTANRLDAFDDL